MTHVSAEASSPTSGCYLKSTRGGFALHFYRFLIANTIGTSMGGSQNCLLPEWKFIHRKSKKKEEAESGGIIFIRPTNQHWIDYILDSEDFPDYIILSSCN